MTHVPSTVSVAFVTLGCPKNEVDSDRMAAAVRDSAYELVASPDDADVVVLNTCAFIQPATEESIAESFALVGEWRPARDGRRVVVAGCLVSRYGSELAEAMPEPDAFLPVAEEDRVLAVIEKLTGVPAHARTNGIARLAGGFTAYLKISEGCDRRCAYCTIPAIRGRFVSAAPESIVAEARFLIGGGARELILVGQDVSRYGSDRAELPDLASLVGELAILDGDYRLRLMYVQPDGVTDRLLEVMAAHQRICDYLDIPLQHSSARVLKAMGRPGSRESHLRLLARIRAALPDVVLRTTVMAGFPGETEDDLRDLEEFISEAELDYVGVFPFFAEDGTRAAGMPDQVPEELRRDRAQRLRDAADAIGFARAASRVGSVQRVLVEGRDEDGELVGRSDGQAPEVDGVTFLERDAPAGTLATVRITDSVGYDSVGVLS